MILKKIKEKDMKILKMNSKIYLKKFLTKRENNNNKFDNN